MTNIVIGAGFVLFVGGVLLWSWACWACFALMVTSPIGGLLSRYWAHKHGFDPNRCTRLGALYWAFGFMPWLYFAFQINGRTAPRTLMKAIYIVLLLVWLVGPVIAGFFHADSPGRESLAWVPIANLLGWIVALVCLAFAKVLPAGEQRVHICHVIPSLLAVLAMLSWLPFRWIA